jgi:transcription antitermination factor NusG
MTDKSWYVIYTSGAGSRGVMQIQSLLDRMEYEGTLFVPTIKSTITRYGKPQENNKPLFPSYVFIHTYIEDSRLEQALIEAKIGRFLHAPGDDTHPTKISDVTMEHIKGLEEIGVEDVPEELVAVEVGNLVEVCVGPFMGIKGIVTKVSGHDVYVETLVFGRSAPVRFNASHLSKIGNNNETDSM